ncbi:MAG: PAS domain S-box protein [Planctomycetota bacterium]
MPDRATSLGRWTFSGTVLRLLLPPVLTVGLFVAAAFGYFIPALETGFLQQKRESLRDQVHTVLASLASRESEIHEGLLTEADARARALRRLRDIRYGRGGKDYFWILDTDGRVVMHPYRSELVGQNVLDYRDRNDIPVFRKMVQIARSDGEGFLRYEWQWKDQPGRLEPKLSYVQIFAPWGWIVGSGVYLEDVEREVAAVRRRIAWTALGILVPILLVGLYAAHQGLQSERRRRQAEADLRRSEEQFRSFVVNANDIVYSLDPDGIFTYVSPNWADRLGHPADEVIGTTFKRHVHPEDIPRCEAFLHEILTTGEKLADVEYRVRHRDGSWRWHASNGGAVFDEDGVPLYYVGIARDITERKQMVDRIEEQIRFRESLLAAVAIPLYYKDTAKRYLGCNPAFSAFSGASVADLQGKTAYDTLPPDLAAECDRYDDELLANPGIQHYELCMRDRDGRPRDTLFTKAPFFDSEGALAGLIGTFVDITELRQAEATLREKEHRHAVLFAAARTMQFVLDRDGTLVECDDLAESITGRSAAELVGHGFTEAFLPGEPWRTRFNEAWERLATGGEFRNLEIELTIPGGWRRTVILNAVLDRAGDGDARVLMSGQDVTALRVAQRQQRVLEERLREILARAPVVLLIMDEDRRVLYCSENVHRIFGVHPERLTAAPLAWREVLHPDDRAAAERLLAEAFDVDGPIVGEVRIRPGETGDGVWARAQLVRGRDPGSGHTAVSIVLLDIDDEKAAQARADTLQAQLLQAEKLRAIGELAGGIAHDFNNLLAGIMGSAELLLLRGSVEEGATKYVERIIETSNQAALLIQQIKTFARKTEVERQEMDLHEAVRAAAMLLSHTLDRRIRVREALDAPDPTILGDPAQLRSAVLNLAVNARDAMPEGGVLTFRTVEERIDPEGWAARGADLPAGDYLRLDISDTGTGMPPEVQERVFEPFYTTKLEGKGMGLGLASVYGCVQLHNGHIALDSTPGAGATFSIWLPRAAPGEAGGGAASDTVDYAEGSGRIAVVDDEPLVRHNAVLLLQNLGYEVRAFENGRAFLAYYAEHADEVDAILLDMIMPELRGEEVFREIRRIRPDARVVITTGYAEDETLQRLQREGIKGVITKPFRLDALSHFLADVLAGDQP